MANHSRYEHSSSEAKRQSKMGFPKVLHLSVPVEIIEYDLRSGFEYNYRRYVLPEAKVVQTSPSWLLITAKEGMVYNKKGNPMEVRDVFFRKKIGQKGLTIKGEEK